MLLAWIAGCAPVLPDPTSIVTTPRVVAVSTDPPEAAAGADFTLTALYADATGELATAPVDWSFCTVPRPLAELGPVNGDCLVPGDESLAPIATGASVAAVVPDDACSLFGPNPPPPIAGNPPGRPADPDVTGGFYQPIVGFDGDAVTLAAERVRCGIANVSQETYIAWNTGYVDNANPAFTAEVPATAAPGEAIDLSVDWGESAESYLVYDPVSGELLTRREAISATWFATGGSFEELRNGRGSDDLETTVTNRWTAPDTAGEAWIWVVLRDERGGVAFTGFPVDVAP
jgi:hypothetical protein